MCRNALLAVLIPGALVLQGCALLFDRQPPVPGGAIQFTSITSTSVTLSWPAARDGYGGELSYQLYMSTDPSNIATLAALGSRSGDHPVTAWTSGMTSATVNGLTPGVTYYFNVAVQDSQHNTAAYKQAMDAWATYGTEPLLYDMHDGGTLAVSVTVPGGGPYDVYAITTNTGTSANAVPTAAALPSVTGTGSRTLQSVPSLTSRSSSTPSNGPAIVDPPQVTAFRRNPATLTTGTFRGQFPAPTAGPQYYTVGVSSVDFYDDNNNVINATLRIQTSNGGETVNVWAPDNPWTQNGASITAAADHFLKSTGASDIYHWETNIYGPPWGSTPYSNLISNDNTVNILFMPMGGSVSSTVIGFFYPRDNYLRTSGTGGVTDYSNQMVMFYMNSDVYQRYSTIESNGYTEGENLIISTLAHEFQHMIHFYQKTVLRAGGRGTETWINEMMSMMTEDILAYNVNVDGPRGVAFDDPTDGTAHLPVGGYVTGRFPEFDANDDISLSSWGSVNILASYAAAYAFGAFLERNFGGAQLLHDMMYNSYTDSRAITMTPGVEAATLSPAGMAGLLTKWAAAVMLSDNAAPPPPPNYYYNTGGWFPNSSFGSYSTYYLGSINAFNYSWKDANNVTKSGPFIYPQSSAITPAGGSQGPYSSQYIELATGVTAGTTVTRSISVGENNYVTIIVK